jgi:aminoglycoside/choline kinase family phosphotransferase
VDERLAALRRWLAGPLAGTDFSLAPASADASFRRYFRATLADGRSYVAMDAPPGQEDCGPYVRVAAMLRAAGVHAPEIPAADLAQGFLLLEDLGSRTYLDAFAGGEPAPLVAAATDALLRWQLASRPGELPEYDRPLLERELQLFPDWYLGRHLDRRPSAADALVLRQAFDLVLANNLAQPRVYVHRDYHSRNLMVCEPLPGVLDFQDAVHGPITYDLVSLLRDAYVRWDEERVLDWAIRYWEKARRAQLPVAADFADFYRDFEWMGVQRQLKVLGIFARLRHRDGKDRYLADMPLVLDYLLAACRRYRELRPLALLLERVQAA